LGGRICEDDGDGSGCFIEGKAVRADWWMGGCRGLLAWRSTRRC
jgi:hypothetical protein